jgi:hypothetical protein
VVRTEVSLSPLFFARWVVLFMLIRGGWGGLVSIYSPLLRRILAPTMAGEQSWVPALVLGR